MMIHVLPVLFLGLITPDSTESLAICANMCFDHKPICAVSTRGIMMEFHSPCYMIKHNICYGTDYETMNVGLCPRPESKIDPTEKVLYAKVEKEQSAKSNH